MSSSNLEIPSSPREHASRSGKPSYSERSLPLSRRHSCSSISPHRGCRYTHECIPKILCLGVLMAYRGNGNTERIGRKRGFDNMSVERIAHFRDLHSKSLVSSTG